MQTEMEPPTDSIEHRRWDDPEDEYARDEFGEDDDLYADVDELPRPADTQGPAHSPPEILRALSLWAELDEDEFSDFDDEDFDDEFDDDFEEELEDEYEELEDDFGDDGEELDEDLDDGFEEDLDGEEEIDDATDEGEDLDEADED